MAGEKYREIQKFGQVWLWALMAAMAAGYVGMHAFILVKSPGLAFQPGFLFSTLFGAVITGGVIALLLACRLTVAISARGLAYEFFPFHWKPRFIDWAEVRACYVRKYRPVAEYGGWGIRCGWGGRGRAYNVKGNMGIQLELKDGSRILFGTQRPGDVERIIRELGMPGHAPA
jgi:uncharacterized membrane protein (DUF485 family)